MFRQGAATGPRSAHSLAECRKNVGETPWKKKQTNKQKNTQTYPFPLKVQGINKFATWRVSIQNWRSLARGWAWKNTRAHLENHAQVKVWRIRDSQMWEDEQSYNCYVDIFLLFILCYQLKRAFEDLRELCGCVLCELYEEKTSTKSKALFYDWRRSYLRSVKKQSYQN